MNCGLSLEDREGGCVAPLTRLENEEEGRKLLRMFLALLSLRGWQAGQLAMSGSQS